MRFKVISRWGSYHGATRGALSASGVSDRRDSEPLDSGFIHVPAPYCYRCPWGKSPDSCAVECAEAVGEAIRQEGPETVSSVIVDPVMMASGVIVPPKRYFERLREIADKYGVLLIFDEVATGFGRTGEMFAANLFDVLPDIICLGKGMSSGYAPVAATVARSFVVEAFRGEENRKFLHGHTFGGYPLGCEVALEAIATLIEEDLVARGRAIGEYLGDRLGELADRHPEVGDVRGTGVLWGIEFVSDRQSKTPFDRRSPFAAWVRDHALDRGVITRGSNGVIVLSPALMISKEEVDEIVSAIDSGIGVARKRLKTV